MNALTHPIAETKAGAFVHLCSGCDGHLQGGAFCPSCDDVMPGYFLREDAANPSPMQVREPAFVRTEAWDRSGVAL